MPKYQFFALADLPSGRLGVAAYETEAEMDLQCRALSRLGPTVWAYTREQITDLRDHLTELLETPNEPT